MNRLDIINSLLLFPFRKICLGHIYHSQVIKRRQHCTVTCGKEQRACGPDKLHCNSGSTAATWCMDNIISTGSKVIMLFDSMTQKDEL